jgi:hypothetical protein
MFRAGYGNVSPRRRLLLSLAVGVNTLLASAGDASAQDERRVGITMAYPASIGAWLPLSERISLRPDASFSWSSYDTTIEDSFGRRELSSHYTVSSVGASAIVRVAQWQGLRTYVAPRLAYVRTSQTSPSFTYSPVGSPPVIEESTDVTDGYQVGATFGASYPLHDRLRVFGEVGAMFTAEEGERDVNDRVSQKSFANRTSIGLVLFF